MQAAFPQLLKLSSVACRFAASDILYTGGAIIYTRRRPNPLPQVFGITTPSICSPSPRRRTNTSSSPSFSPGRVTRTLATYAEEIGISLDALIKYLPDRRPAFSGQLTGLGRRVGDRRAGSGDNHAERARENVRRAIVALAATLALAGFAWAGSGTLAHEAVASAWSSGLGH